MFGAKGRTKKPIGVVQALNKLKPANRKTNKSKKASVKTVTPDKKQELRRKEIAQQDDESEESEEFDPELVRMSFVEGDVMDQFSLDSQGNEVSSDDGSMYTEEEKAMILRSHRLARKFPKEVAIAEGDAGENPSTDDDGDDDDDVYIDDVDLSQEGDLPEVYERSDDDSEEGEEDDAFDENIQSTFRKHNRNPLGERGQGVADSVIAYTTGGSLAVSINQIDKMMENRESNVIRDPDAPPQVDHEDSAEVLDQLNRALRSSMLHVDPPYAEAASEPESELQAEMNESYRLERDLDESWNNSVLLEEKLHSSKAKMLELEEVGEQVHMARAFALQSVKLKDFALEKHDGSAQLRFLSRGRRENDVVICEEKSSDESDGDSDKLHDILVVHEDDEVDGSVEGGAPMPTETLFVPVSKTSEEVESPQEMKQEPPSFGGDDHFDSVHAPDEDFSPYNDELNQAVANAMNSVRKENDRDQGEAFREFTLERTSSRDEAVPSETSPEAKLRTSLQKARQMEEVGEQVRQDRFQEVGGAERDERSNSRANGVANSELTPQMNSQQSEMQSAEIFELRARLQEQQQQIEKLEEDRGYNASKIAELTSVIQRSGTDDLLQHLTDKAIQVAELNHEVAVLREELSRAADRSTVLEAERDANKTVIASLSASLWKKDPLSGGPTDEDDAGHSLMKRGGVIPENDALGMTIASLQKKIEDLEEERAVYKETVETLTNSIVELTQENDAKMRQIAALESQFIILNKRSHSSSVVLGPAKSQQNQEKLQRFKTWANNKINQAHEQYENIKSDIEIRRDVTNPDQVLT